MKLLGTNTAILSITILGVAFFWKDLRTLFLSKSPVVKTSSGYIQGKVSYSREGSPFYEFLGIPYAKPPIGDLRFEAPEPSDAWEDVRSAFEYGSKCLQVDLFTNRVEGNEDCLTLNVHTKNVDGNISSDKLMPVIVWFHGGVFIFGSGIMYRPLYFMDEDIVIVTVNYRLGSFGFLNSGDGVIRGNFGLKDQNLALEWIKNNIINFGGDPNSVTLLGESAGGASAHYHMLSPMSRGLFHRAISQSGSATAPWALQKDPSAQAKRFAEKLNCTTTDSKLMAACLKSRSAEEIVNVHLETIDPLRELASVFVPSLEVNITDGKTFLTKHPKHLLATGDYSKVDFLTGYNAHEGLINSAVIVRNDTLTKLLSTHWKKWLPRLLWMNDDINEDVLDKIKTFYFPDGLPSAPQSLMDYKNLTDMFSDRFWVLNLYDGIKDQIKYSKVYLYFYSREAMFSLTDFMIPLTGKHNPELELVLSKVWDWVAKWIFDAEENYYGVCHGDEVAMQFYIPIPFMPYIATGHQDLDFSKHIVKTWTDFARGEKLMFKNVQWPAQSPDEPFRYMKLDEDPVLISEPYIDRVKFWQSISENL